MIETAVRQNRPLPPRIANAPELFLGLQLYFIGFLDITDERELGWAEGPIPWRAIHEYCMSHDIVGEQREDFFYHIKQLDHAYLKWRAEKTKDK